MKFIIVTIKRNTTRGEPTMQYPAMYDRQVVKDEAVGPIIYNGGMSINGLDESECLLLVPDRIANAWEADPDIRIADKAAADLWIGTGNAQEDAKPSEEVTDDQRLRAIDTKIAAGVTLSASDLNALDPTNPERGINNKRTTSDEYYPVQPTGR